VKIIALDPSGNFKEGKGTTGICVMEDGVVTDLTVLKASDFDLAEEYWAAHEDYIQREWPDHLVFEGYKLYNHKGKEAKMQANSELETPQLVGILKHTCYRLDIPYTVQFASEVKSRWQEAILVHLGYLEAKGGKWYWKGKVTLPHHRDSLKHALHYWRYKHAEL
jgi:hypothetical protein